MDGHTGFSGWDFHFLATITLLLLFLFWGVYKHAWESEAAFTGVLDFLEGKVSWGGGFLLILFGFPFSCLPVSHTTQGVKTEVVDTLLSDLHSTYATV